MSSRFIGWRNADEDAGAGGKITRRRRYAVAAAVHPYCRPENSPRSGRPGWISGLLAPARTIAAGAGKFLSFALGSQSEQSSASSSDVDSSEDSSDDGSNNSKEVGILNQRGTTVISSEECPLNTPRTSQKSELKRKIEHLILQETFTRDEYTELMKIIQSRVVDFSTLKEGEGADGRTVGIDMDFSDARLSSSQAGKSLKANPFHATDLSAPLVSPALQESPDNLCSTAIVEAKKWLEEKKLEPCSNSERDCGHRPSSADVLNLAVEGDMASPIDMAKSYMRSRPPWASASWKKTEIKTFASVGIRYCADESPHSIIAHDPTTSIEELKRNTDSHGLIEEARRVRQKLTNDALDDQVHKKVDSPATMLDYQTAQVLPLSEKEEDSAPKKCVTVVSIQGLEVPQMNKEAASFDLGSHESRVLVSSSVQCGAREVLDPGPEAAVLERDTGLLPFDDDVNHNGAPASSAKISNPEEKKGQEENPLPLFESIDVDEAFVSLGSIPEVDDKQRQRDANRVGNIDSVNGFHFFETSLTPALDVEPHSKPADEMVQDSTVSTNDELTVCKSMENCTLSREVTIELSAANEDNTTLPEEMKTAATKKLDEEPPVQPQKRPIASKSGMRGKKVYPQRSRGRPKIKSKGK